MTLSEKVAYLKGLEAGLKLNADRPESKLFKAIIDILTDMSREIENNAADAEDMNSRVDEIDMDLGDLEELIYSVLTEDEDDEDSDEEAYEVECPSCHTAFEVDDSVLESGSIECPKCGEKLEFEVSVEYEAADTEEV